MITITEEDFFIFESVRVSGLVNMADTHAVSKVSGLDVEMIRALVLTYDILAERLLTGNGSNGNEARVKRTVKSILRLGLPGIQQRIHQVEQVNRPEDALLLQQLKVLGRILSLDARN